MLSAKEIETYLHGASGVQDKEQFTFDEARRFGDTMGLCWNTYGIKQFALGVNAELEHGRKDSATEGTLDDPILTEKIALAHLKEYSDYYTRWAVMEQEPERVT
jgi:hypothetical protein